MAPLREDFGLNDGSKSDCRDCSRAIVLLSNESKRQLSFVVGTSANPAGLSGCHLEDR